MATSLFCFFKEWLYSLLQTVTTEELEVRRCVEEAAIIVRSDVEPSATCTITLTSPIMRESNLTEGGIDSLHNFVKLCMPVSGVIVLAEFICFGDKWIKTDFFHL